MQRRTRPVKPSWLSTEGKEVWDFIEPLLVEAEMVTALDSFALAQYSQIAGQIAAIEKHLEGKALMTKREFKLLCELGEQLLPLSDRLGLNPLARQCPESVLAIHYREGVGG